MSTYYEDDACTIYHGDCREVGLLRSLTADVVITDPPYGVELATKSSDYSRSGRQTCGGSFKASVLYQDSPEATALLIGEVFPPLLEQIPRALVFAGPKLMWKYPTPAAFGCVFTPNGAGRCAWGFQVVHPILYYGSDPFLADGKGGRPTGFRTEQPNREKFDHPCPKPLRWMTWAVERASRPGEIVLDPFMGSGTTLVAAKQCGRKAIGIELSERYCEIAATRLAQGALAL